MINLEEGFLKDTVKRLRYYKDLGDKTFEQLEQKDFSFRLLRKATALR